MNGLSDQFLNSISVVDFMSLVSISWTFLYLKTMFIG